MKIFGVGTLLVVVAFVSLLHGCTSGETPRAKWFKGNLHTHSYWSDGDGFPEMILDWYKTHGYDFIALSDHNTIAEGEKWVVIPDSRTYRDGFEEYLAKLGDEWVDHKMDSGRIHVKLKTYSEYMGRYADEDFLVIRAEEITDGYEGKPIHMNATNIQTLIGPQGGRSVVDVMQRNLDAVIRQREETGAPMFPHLNHPNFYNAVTIEDMMALKGERFFEVYNGHPLVNNYGDSLQPGTEEMWDRVNVAYAERGQPLLYGLATDDSHNYHQFGSAYSNAGRGWVMVQSDTLTTDNLIRGMEEGKFYATTGVVLTRVEVKEKFLYIEVDPQPGVLYTIQFIGVKRNDKMSTLLKSVSGTKAGFTLEKDFVFVRAKITSDKVKENPFQDGDVETAWTQPVLLE